MLGTLCSRRARLELAWNTLFETREARPGSEHFVRDASGLYLVPNVRLRRARLAVAVELSFRLDFSLRSATPSPDHEVAWSSKG